MSGGDQLAVEALVGVIGTLQAQLERQQVDAARAREADRKEISRLVAMVEGLTQQLDRLLGDQEAERKAELARQRDEARAVVAAIAAAEPASEGPAPKPDPNPKNRDAHGRKPLPESLPREVREVPRPEICDRCEGADLVVKETVVTEECHYVRAHLRVLRTERTVCTCKNCLARITPEMPPMPFDRAACTFALMAWLLYAKCGLFLPLDRLQRDFADQGHRIPSPTMNRWFKRGADLLLPVAAAVRLSLLTGTHIRTDGTGLRVVFPRVKGKPVKGPARPGETDADGYLLARDAFNGQILIFGDDEHAVYHFTETKAGQEVLDFLEIGRDADGQALHWKGTITADAVSSHDILFTTDDRIEAGCNAHGLRKFRDDADKAPLLASRALAFIAKFYTAEAKAREKGLTGTKLLAWRLEHAKPHVDQFRIWIDGHIEQLLPTNPVRKALQYYLNHWPALTRFLTDPAVELDNNWSERALRKVNLIRNNSLYAGGIQGAKRLCTLLTLIGTARQTGVDPYCYMEWALERSVAHRANRGLTASNLTPAAYKSAQQARAQ